MTMNFSSLILYFRTMTDEKYEGILERLRKEMKYIIEDIV